MNPSPRVGLVTEKQSLQLDKFPGYAVELTRPVVAERVTARLTGGPKLSINVVVDDCVSALMWPTMDMIVTATAPPKAKKAKRLIAFQPILVRVFPVFLLVLYWSFIGIGHRIWDMLSRLA